MSNPEKSHFEELLTCPVCQDIFRDPRQLPCGHSICMACLENMMDHTAGAPFRCPDCRADLGSIIGIQKSYALASIAEDFRMEQRRRREEAAKNVYCDCCSGKTTLAMKTCLKCKLSLCEEHVGEHLKLPMFTGHPLVQPLGDLQERKCPQHEDEVLRFYCSTSRRYICNLCALESKQLNLATETATLLRRQLMDALDQRLTTLTEQYTASADLLKKLQEDLRRERQKVNPLNLRVNSVTLVLLSLWFIALYYAFHFSGENYMLTDALNK